MNAKSEMFNYLINELRDFYKKSILIDVKIAKSKFEKILEIIEGGEDIKEVYLAFFINLIDEIKSAINQRELMIPVHILDFFMRKWKWPEVEDALKLNYSHLADPNAKLEVESLIKKIYDPLWAGGEFDFLQPDQSMWEK